MELDEQVHISDLSNIRTFEPYISLIRLFSLFFNCAKPLMSLNTHAACSNGTDIVQESLDNHILIYIAMIIPTQLFEIFSILHILNDS